MSTLTLVLAFVVSIAITSYFVRRLSARAEKSGTDWRRVGIFFVVMLLGMLAREAFDSVTKKQQFNLGDLVVPLLISPIIFGLIYGNLGSLEINVPSLVLAFQNGFFWSALWEGVQANQSGAS